MNVPPPPSPPPLPPPPPPPPPPPRNYGIRDVKLIKPQEKTPVFTLHENDAQHMEFEFPRTLDDSGTVSLRTVIGHYLGCQQSSRVSADKIFEIIGRLRCLQYALMKYNRGKETGCLGFLQYWRRHTMNILSGFGFRSAPETHSASIRVAGLDDLLTRLEAIYKCRIHEARQTISSGFITFDALSELFRPDTHVKASIVSSAAPSVFRVTDAFYEERQGLLGSQKQFRVTLEAVASLGEHFTVASFSKVLFAWGGGAPRNLSDFAYQPVLQDEKQFFIKRAEQCVTYAIEGPKYLAYTPGSFYLHSISVQRHNAASMTRSPYSAQSLTGGRIMVDVGRGASMGHYPCQGMDEATLAIIQVMGRYRQWMLNRSRSEPLDTAPLVLWDDVPSELLITCWPALVGYSFAAKSWGHVLVSSLSSINFQEQAFERLVLSQERKNILRAVLRYGTTSQTQHLISGKQGGLLFLLHGPPGVGKTLTAKAVAEVLHKPLYHVSMGELGVTLDELERRLTDVLELCAEWGAVAVLDDADVLLEMRSISDFVQNAMVCVMLRILECHSGILFLTTNRVRALDPAFESRITLALKYEALDHDARLEIWKNQLNMVEGTGVSEFRYAELAEHPLNGGQIKNTVRLARALASDQGTEMTQSILVKILEITSLGRQNIDADISWERVTTI